jgi:hypothetical protein
MSVEKAAMAAVSCRSLFWPSSNHYLTPIVVRWFFAFFELTNFRKFSGRLAQAIFFAFYHNTETNSSFGSRYETTSSFEPVVEAATAAQLDITETTSSFSFLVTISYYSYYYD